MLEPAELENLKLYRRAADYIGAAQIYLKSNALLKEPLKPEHIKERLLGHWGTVPGINLVYAHLNRLVRRTRASVLLITGPGHGAPANLANLYLEGTMEEFYPDLTRDTVGLHKLVRAFSWPGGFPSHLNPGIPGVIHEGGELGYALAKGFGAALDNPDLLVAVIVGDGEAETGPTATAWHGTKYLDPKTCGAVLPILHDNSYKISSKTISGAMSDEEIDLLYRGYGWLPRIAAIPGKIWIPRSPTPSTGRTAKSAAFKKTPAPATRANGRPGRCSSCVRRKGWAHPRSGTASRSPGPGAPIRYRSPSRAPTPRRSPPSRGGCGATSRRSCSTRPAGPSRRSSPAARRATCASE